MEKDDIINYVMETPGNSNPAVLGSMLESYSGGGGSGGGADGVFIIHAAITYVSDDNYTVTTTESMSDIVAALADGKALEMYANKYGGDPTENISTVLYLTSGDISDGSDIYLSFQSISWIAPANLSVSIQADFVSYNTSEGWTYQPILADVKPV